MIAAVNATLFASASALVVLTVRVAIRGQWGGAAVCAALAAVAAYAGAQP